MKQKKMKSEYLKIACMIIVPVLFALYYNIFDYVERGNDAPALIYLSIGVIISCLIWLLMRKGELKKWSFLGIATIYWVILLYLLFRNFNWRFNDIWYYYDSFGELVTAIAMLIVFVVTYRLGLRKKMTEKIKIFLIFLLVVLLSGYTAMSQDNEHAAKYTFVRHDSIPMPFADSIVAWSGCKVATKGLTAKHHLYYYAALTPYYPLVKTYTDYRGIPFEERVKVKCFDLTKGMIQQCITYKTIINGDTIVVDSHEKFREIFAPVTSVQEAIAFAYIFTDSKPIYNLDFLEPFVKPQYHYYELADFEEICLKNGKKQMNAITKRDSMQIVQPIDEGWDIFLPEIISSYAKETDDGYELLLYHYVVFGGFHPYMRRLIKVTFDGKVEIKEECAAFANRKDYGLEVD